jgi:hypothetical protein
MQIHQCSEDDDPQQASKAMRAMFGPQAVDSAMRQAVSTCWMMLPDGKKNVASLEAEIRRIFERAIENLKEDAAAFGITPEK